MYLVVTLYFSHQKNTSSLQDTMMQRMQTCSDLWTYHGILIDLLCSQLFASHAQMPSPHIRSVDRCKEGPSQGIGCRQLKAHPSLQYCLALLNLDSCYLGAFLLCPYPAKVQPHSTVYKDSVTRRNKAGWAYGLSQQSLNPGSTGLF